MALIDITPVMTSDTTPSPYVVSASSSLDNASLPFLAFDGKESTYYHSKSGMSQWIKIDFGMVTDMSAISLKASPSSVNYTGIPKHFILYGSNDDVTYEKIHQEENETLWSYGENRLYNIGTEVSFRYYKLNVISTNGYGYVVISEIGFYKKDVTPPINNKTNSLKYTLPFGSKLRLDNLTSDLTYMLATEDDGDNEGTLRIVNHAGKFILPKAGQKMDLLFSGVASANGEYILNNSIKKYKQLIFVANHLTNLTFRQSNIITTDDITSYTSTQYTHNISCFVSSSNTNNIIYISFSSENTFNIYSANNIIGIFYVYGIY